MKYYDTIDDEKVRKLKTKGIYRDPMHAQIAITL